MSWSQVRSPSSRARSSGSTAVLFKTTCSYRMHAAHDSVFHKSPLIQSAVLHFSAWSTTCSRAARHTSQRIAHLNMCSRDRAGCRHYHVNETACLQLLIVKLLGKAYLCWINIVAWAGGEPRPCFKGSLGVPGGVNIALQNLCC